MKHLKKNFLQGLLCCLLLAMSGYAAASAPITLDLKNKTVRDVIKEIEKTSDYRFFYDEDLPGLNTNVNVQVSQETIIEVLDRLAQQANIAYSIRDDHQVVLSAKATVPQQNGKRVTGTVTDAKGETVIGANVVEKGTANGIITDVDGKFTLTVKENAVLQISFVGFVTQEITVGDQTSLNIILTEDVQTLEEIVTLGYASSKRRDMIGSVAKISSEAISTPSYSNITAGLQGKASGLYVSGSTVRIRGINSISLSAEPLWIIDGVPGNGSDMNPNDIESVTVLKDASATALYGSSGANGVIVITTKSFSGKKTGINIEIDRGISSYIGTGYKTLNSKEFIELFDLALANEAKYQGATSRLYDPNASYSMWPDMAGWKMTREEAMTYSHNWPDDYTQQGQYLQAHLSGNHTADKGNTMFSLTYRNDKTVAKGGGEDKLLGRVAFDYSPLNIVKISFNTINHFRASDNATAGSTLIRPPFTPLYDASDPTGYWGPSQNELMYGDDNYYQNRTKSFTSTNYLRADIDLPFLEGLRISGVGSGNFAASRNTIWGSEEMKDAMSGSDYTSWASEISVFDYSAMVRGEISYNHVFGDHSVSALGLVEAKKNYGFPMNSSGYNLNGSYPMLGSPGNISSATATRVEGGSLAYIGRVAYNFKSKYLIEANIRRDGLSTLSANNRWATFPSIGLGWVVSDESFWNIQAINLMKIRGSIGKTGNAAVPSFTYIPGFTINYPSGDSWGGDMFTTITNIASDVKWETSDNMDIGIDFGLFNNRINGSIAYYNKETSGLLLQVPLPTSAGISGNSIWANVGNMRNSGIELTLDAYPIQEHDFSWNLSFNFTSAKNEILALEPSVDVTGQGIFGANDGTLTRKGGELATYYISEFAGIDAQKGIPMIWERDQEIFAKTGETVRTGKLIPGTEANCNGNRFYQDGKSYMPSYYGGLRNTFRYKALDLSLMLSFSGGHYYYDRTDWNLHYIRIGENALAADILEKSWKNPGDANAEYQEIIYNGGFYYDNAGNPSTTLFQNPSQRYPNTSQWLKKADNVQLKEITLGYTLPKTYAHKVGAENLRLYLNANNVLYWAIDEHNGSPDIDIQSNNVDGAQRGASFLTRTLSLGLSIKF